MPKPRTVLKRQRQNVKRRGRNRAIRSELRTLERRVREATEADARREAFTAYQSSLDRAAGDGIVHGNKAARKKARLSSLLSD